VRDSRERGLSSAEIWGTTKPTGRPDAPAAACAASSKTWTCQPLRAKACATLAPDRPAPITQHCRGCAALEDAGGSFAPKGQVGLKVAHSVSPSLTGSTKPASCNHAAFGAAGRRATRVAPREQMRASALAVHLSQGRPSALNHRVLANRRWSLKKAWLSPMHSVSDTWPS